MDSLARIISFSALKAAIKSRDGVTHFAQEKLASGSNRSFPNIQVTQLPFPVKKLTSKIDSAVERFFKSVPAAFIA